MNFLSLLFYVRQIYSQQFNFGNKQRAPWMYILRTHSHSMDSEYIVLSRVDLNWKKEQINAKVIPSTKKIL